MEFPPIHPFVALHCFHFTSRLLSPLGATQGSGIVGLNQLRHLRVLDLAGNPMLQADQVLLALTGGEPDVTVPALVRKWTGEETSRPMPARALESVTLGIRSSKNLVRFHVCCCLKLRVYLPPCVVRMFVSPVVSSCCASVCAEQR